MLRSWHHAPQCLLGAVLFLAGIARADHYWVAYEGDDYPENQGWQRVFGDDGVPGQGGANRSVSNGIFTLDSLFSDQVYDYYEIDRSTMPRPGELFMAEWRALVDSRSGIIGTGVVIARDGGHVVFFLGADGVRVNYDEGFISLAPDTFHTFQFVSSDMVSYKLTIDDSIVYNSVLERSLLTGTVSFGDGAYGGNQTLSLSEWDYFRFGVVPEPASVAGLACLLASSWLRAALRQGAAA